MTHDTRLDLLARGWRGALAAALVALIAGLPGLIALPVLDREEAAFAQATAQMLEVGDIVDVRAQDQADARQPIGLHWLQAATVSTFSSTEARAIWAYRLPSLLGAMLAAAACAWGGAVFFGPGTGMLAGAILGGCQVLSTEAGIGRTDAVLCGAVALALAALGRLYAEAGGGPAVGARTRPLFWLGVALALLDKGLLGLTVIALTGLALWAWDRQAPWARRLGWTWGLILCAALVGPWVAAVTVRTDGGVWTAGQGFGDSAGGGLPGLHLVAAPLLLFPATALLPAALVEGWKSRTEPGPRFALCWLIPNWLVLEATPLRLIHHALPLYGALAWLAAYALMRPIGRWTRIAGAVLSVLTGAAIAVGVDILASRYGDASSLAPAMIGGLLALAAGLVGTLIVSARWRLPALAAAGVLGVAAHGAIAAGLAPRLGPLWLTRGVVETLDRSHLNPRDGLTPGPVTVVGYDEPSLVFALGTETELGDVDAAAEAIAEGRPVVIARRDGPAFQQALAAGALKASLMGSVAGLDYAGGQAARLDVYRSDSPPPEVHHDEADRNAAGAAEPGPGPIKPDLAKPGSAKPGPTKPSGLKSRERKP